MLIDARSVDRNREFAFDLCIVGGGAAGIALARELAGGGISIGLLESGGFDPDRETQSLYDGWSEGRILGEKRNYLSTSRLRYFGGSTNHWGGWCRPLDPLDFEERSWVPHSGWPITRSELEDGYRRAAGLVEIPLFDRRCDDRREGALPLAGDRVVTRCFHMSPPTLFGRSYRAELVEARAIRLFLHANAVEIETNRTASRVTRVAVATLGGKRFGVSARVFVLAAGAVENARLLLASDRVRAGGLGNQHDRVGRFFMDHPHIEQLGEVVLTGASRNHHLYSLAQGLARPGREVGLLCPSERTQREERLLNIGIQLISFRRQLPGDPGSVIGRGAQRLDRLGRAAERRAAGGPQYARLDARCEPSPNPESRVTLDRETDALGMRRARLEWRVGAGDAETVRRWLEIAAAELGRSAQGRGRLLFEPLDPWRTASARGHHMGTTRMSDTPKQGVVDRDCRVHGVSNLFVAGSSVFPTAGFANPTFTILALALRLADHLRSVLRGG